MAVALRRLARRGVLSLRGAAGAARRLVLGRSTTAGRDPLVSLDAAGLLSRLQQAKPVVVAIPVFNGGGVLAACLESVCRWTPTGVRILVLDDCSTDATTRSFLDEVSVGGRVTVLRNTENLGYTRNANRAIAEASGSDIVLLNSDTVVGPLWLQRLRWAAHGDADVAAVSAVSDNAGALSVPVPGAPNDWGDDWDSASRANAQAQFVGCSPAVTGHGFCMYFRREALEEVGLFDEEAFPRGYGEENDWSMRARERGWSVLVAPGVLVRHLQGQSFGDERAERIAQAKTVLNERYPGYSRSVGEWLASDDWKRIRKRARRARQRLAAAPPRPRRLYVLHHSGGGTPETNRDLMTALSPDQDSLLLLAHTAGADLYRIGIGRDRIVESWITETPFTISDTWRPDFAAFIARVLAEHAIELIHIRHLIDQPLTTIPTVARLMQIPFVLSTHDFYYICPSVNLLDGNLSHCGGECTPGTSRCFAPNAFVRGAANLKHDWVHVWRRHAAQVLDAADAIVVTTPSAEAIYRRNYPAFATKLVQIEHGRDFGPEWVHIRSAPADRRPGPLRVLCAANWAPHKGIAFISELVAATSDVVEWHFAGRRSELITGSAVHHGEYARDAFPTVTASIDPDFIGLFSIWPETYSHTLSEAWALGIEVLATDLGAVADRIRAHGGGHVFPLEHPEQLIAFLRRRAARLADGAVPEPRSLPDAHAVRRVDEMAADYRDLYRRASWQN